MTTPRYTFHYTFTNRLKNAFVNGLRAAFATRKVGEQFRYIVGVDGFADNSTLITIYKGYPKKVLKYPAIFISCGSAKHEPTLDDEFLEEIYDDKKNYIGDRYLGRFWFEVMVSVAAMTTLDREQVIDLTLFYLKTMKAEIRKAGIEFQEPTMSGESEKLIGNDNVYMINVNYRCFVEWGMDLSLMEYELLKDIDISTMLDNP